MSNLRLKDVKENNEVYIFECVRADGVEWKGEILATHNTDGNTDSLSGIVYYKGRKETFFLSSAKGIRYDDGKLDKIKFSIFSTTNGNPTDYILKYNSSTNCWYGAEYSTERVKNPGEDFIGYVTLKLSSSEKAAKVVGSEIDNWGKNDGKTFYVRYVDSIFDTIYDKSNLIHHDFDDKVYNRAISASNALKRRYMCDGIAGLRDVKYLLKEVLVHLGKDDYKRVLLSSYEKTIQNISKYLSFPSNGASFLTDKDYMFDVAVRKQQEKESIDALAKTAVFNEGDSWQYAANKARFDLDRCLELELLNLFYEYSKSCPEYEKYFRENLVDYMLSYREKVYAFSYELADSSTLDSIYDGYLYLGIDREEMLKYIRNYLKRYIIRTREDISDAETYVAYHKDRRRKNPDNYKYASKLISNKCKNVSAICKFIQLQIASCANVVIRLGYCIEDLDLESIYSIDSADREWLEKVIKDAKETSAGSFEIEKVLNKNNN